jgi:hypothetical protein
MRGELACTAIADAREVADRDLGLSIGHASGSSTDDQIVAGQLAADWSAWSLSRDRAALGGSRSISTI